MNLTNAKVLITGGSQGIGLGLAKRLLAAGADVLVTGRDAVKLNTVAQALPGIRTYVNDISQAAQRETLALYISNTFPGLNILINNAGIQRRVSLAADKGPWEETQAEINTLLAAPVHLNRLLIPGILSTGHPGLIVNVTSGGAFIPQVFAPVYSACKSALHTYTMILRHSLKNTPCRVVELIPPAVQTGLAGPGLTHGVAIDEFCEDVFSRLFNEDVAEIGYGPTANLQPQLDDTPVNSLFELSATRYPVAIYNVDR